MKIWGRLRIKTYGSTINELIIFLQIKDHVASNLAKYKQLAGGVEFIESLPKNATGKILRRELSEKARKDMQ
mgnify:CR=1 FL=1